MLIPSFSATQSGHPPYTRELFQVTVFRAYNSVTLARDVSQSAWAKPISFSLMEKHTSG